MSISTLSKPLGDRRQSAMERYPQHQFPSLSARGRAARLLLRANAPDYLPGAGPGLDIAAIWADIVKRPYITIGMIRVAIPRCHIDRLALTSSNAMIGRLGEVHGPVFIAGFMWPPRPPRSTSFWWSNPCRWGQSSTPQ
jgi:hypothetical protein